MMHVLSCQTPAQEIISQEKLDAENVLLKRPLLSICIPTFNRAEKLNGALQVIYEQINDLKGEVELIISDNFSDDNSEEIVNNFMKKAPIRYYKNERNIGACKNILKLTQEYALGEFVWIVGDDDLVCSGALKKLCRIIKENPNIDYFFLNHTYENSSNRTQYLNPESAASNPRQKILLCKDTDNRKLEKWENLISLSDKVGIYTSVVSHVFRTTFWQDSAIDVSENKLFETFDSTFPHVSVAMANFFGKPVYYIGTPLITFFIGHQEWINENWARIVFTHLLDFTDQLENRGANKRLVDKYRIIIFHKTTLNLAQLISNEETIRIHLIRPYLSRYWKYGSAWKLIILAVVIGFVQRIWNYFLNHTSCSCFKARRR